MIQKLSFSILILIFAVVIVSIFNYNREIEQSYISFEGLTYEQFQAKLKIYEFKSFVFAEERVGTHERGVVTLPSEPGFYDTVELTSELGYYSSHMSTGDLVVERNGRAYYIVDNEIKPEMAHLYPCLDFTDRNTVVRNSCEEDIKLIFDNTFELARITGGRV